MQPAGCIHSSMCTIGPYKQSANHASQYGHYRRSDPFEGARKVAAVAGSTLAAGSSPVVGVEMQVVVPSLVAGAAEGWAGIAAAGSIPVVGAETVEVVGVAVPIPVVVGIEVAVGAVDPRSAEGAVDIGSI